ncbi:MAG: hypothetical protein V9E88_05600 [Ferruginibacter sp.]
MAVEVFKTNITDAVLAGELLKELDRLIPQTRINFDLEDCDHVLRVEGVQIKPAHIVLFMEQKGFICECL